ncbi:MAG: histidine phosphotransferase family protein [Roseiarcus sp.]|jgi:histidine phosphotransferase ChpT
MTTFALDGMDLAALLCSRVCHDVISPVGAIINGLEVLEDEKEAEMREIALDLIKKSAAAASARLQFCRLAYGAAGSVGASIDTGDAENVTRGLINNDRTKLVWNATRRYAPKNKVKLVLNLCLIAISVIPRGGVVTVALSGEGEALEALVEAKGPNARLAHGVAALIAGTVEGGSVDAHSIQAYYTGLVARSCGLQVTIETAADSIALRASLAVETALAAPG